jgi:hypothetical protein
LVHAKPLLPLSDSLDFSLQSIDFRRIHRRAAVAGLRQLELAHLTEQVIFKPFDLLFALGLARRQRLRQAEIRRGSTNQPAI